MTRGATSEAGCCEATGVFRRRCGGFSLVELMVTLGVVAILLAVLLPALAGAREGARSVRCLSNLRQLAVGWTLYAREHRDLAMPLAYTESKYIGLGDRLYWWGADGSASGEVNHSKGFIVPYVAGGGRGLILEGDVFQCPCQPWGTYQPQGPVKMVTSTYGYNGYYLSPRFTPGWSASIGGQPWKRVSSIVRPSQLAVFADTLLPTFAPNQMPSNNALLDPPMLWSSGTWTVNQSPTTAFRHGRKCGRALLGSSGPGIGALGHASNARADGSVMSTRAELEWLTHPDQGVGSLGTQNDPHHVPDWKNWR